VYNSSGNLKRIINTFKGLATIDTSALSKESLVNSGLYSKKPRSFNSSQKNVLNAFYTYLKGKRYSISTMKTYVFFIADFIDYHSTKPIDSLTNYDVDRFAENVLAKKGYSISSHRQFVSALKLFIEFQPSINIDKLELQRPKKSKILPTVLSQQEVIILLQNTKNLKHRAVLGLIYSAGLRISELINLELSHISIERKQLLIKNSKGRKDRYVVLSESYIPLLKNYYLSYRPKRYFVEGRIGEKYSASSIRGFLKNSCKASNIIKKVSPHTLRHSYATHLMENGVGLRHVQELLGHARPETTMIYTHVMKKDLLDIKSPLDTALQQFNQADKRDEKLLLSRK